MRGTGALAAPPRLTVVRRDATHLVHPVPSADRDGTWRTPVTLPAAGDYRVVVEVSPVAGAPGVLAADLAAPGPFDPVPLTPSRVAEVDGYQVRLDGDLVPGAPAQVFATVSREGAPVTDLEPGAERAGRSRRSGRAADVALVRPAGGTGGAATDDPAPPDCLALPDDDPLTAVDALDLARRTVRTVQCGVTVAVAYHLLALPLAATTLLPPLAAAALAAAYPAAAAARAAALRRVRPATRPAAS